MRGTRKNKSCLLTGAILTGLSLLVFGGCLRKFVGPSGQEECGNGTIEGTEMCDDGDTDNGDGCSDTCQEEAGFLCEDEPSVCTLVCGNGILDRSETCDGTDLAGASCESLGLDPGTLACLADCSDFDTSGCGDTCGDDTIQSNETCDGTNLDGVTCSDLGFLRGTLGCLADCTDFDTTGCIPIPSLVINEVGFGDVDGVEILNTGDEAVDLQGMVLEWWGYLGAATAEGTWVMPAYTLNPGEHVMLLDERYGTGAQPDVNPPVIQFHENIGWAYNPGGAVHLETEGVSIDFVRWGGPVFDLPEGAAWSGDPPYLPGFEENNLTLSRVPDGVDTDQASDFCVATASLGDANLPCVDITEPGTILISEIDVDDPPNPDRVELFNPTASDVDLNGIIIQWASYDDVGSSVLPAYDLAPGAYITILDDSTGASYVDATGIHVSNMGFTFNEMGACWLREPEVRAGVDFVRWGGHEATPAAPDLWEDTPSALPVVSSGSTLGRQSASDTDTAGDFCLMPPSLGSANNACQ